jgi:TRAP-type C4-dicarboxylate transport system substrate-binding protein
VRGIFDIAYQFHGLVADTVKLNQIAKLPFVNTTARGSSVSLWRTYNQYFVRANELAQVQVLALFVLPPGVLFGMDRPIQSIADLRGRRVFSIPGVPARFVEATGAGVVAVPAARSHEIISGGTVDAFASYSVSDAYALRTLPFARHVTDLPGGMTAPSFALIVNQRRWQALPSRDRDIILSLSGEVFARQMAVYDELEARARSVAVTNGIQFHQATDAFVQDLRRLATPLKDSWLADATNLGVNGREAMDFYVAQARANQ